MGYLGSLRKMAQDYQEIKIVDPISSTIRKMVGTLMTPWSAPEDQRKGLGHVLAVIEAQGSFMKVLLGIDCRDKDVTSSCKRWLAFQLKSFSNIDVNGDGKLNTGELADAMAKAPNATKASMYSYGYYGRQEIDFDEMAKHF